MYNQCHIQTVLLVFLYLVNAPVVQSECEPLDCVVGHWNNWSECTEKCGELGTRQRSRLLFREESCGGKCPHELTESEPCNRKCCPKDCVYTPWTKWLLCYCTDAECEGAGERINCRRMRELVTGPECGGYCDFNTTEIGCGQLCCLKDCSMGIWTFWSHCIGQCEQPGTMNRKRSIQQEPHCGGKECGPTIEEKPCPGECCAVDCKLGQWSAWSTCNTTCGDALETRSRFVQLSACWGKDCTESTEPTQTRPCSNYVNVDCVLSPWSVWSECELYNGFCGEGSKVRARTVITGAECQGQPCGDLQEIGVCYGECCTQDCLVEKWGSWGHCSTGCGQGISNRTRAIAKPPSCGGSPCPTTLLQSRDCVVADVIDCDFTPWTSWTNCSTDCGVGSRVRTRVMLTPAYCGGSCENEATRDENECESYTAKQNCEVSEWSEWGECERNCDRGVQRRSRSIIINPMCNGTSCPNLTETRTCHEACSQLCNAAVCSCKPGYQLQSDGISCHGVMCSFPRLQYCPDTHHKFTDCKYPYFRCTHSYRYNSICSPYCLPRSWSVRGSPQTIRCTEDGTWSDAEVYCTRPNEPPLGIEIDKTTLEENRPAGYCFAYLSTTVTDSEKYEAHTYTLVNDVTGRLTLQNNRVCLTRRADFEEKPVKWDAIFRTTDIEGQSKEQIISFEILNANDPPTSVKVEPNVIPENSPAGTVVGCITGTDDDPGQTLTFALVDSVRRTFATFKDGDKICLKVNLESDPLCASDGGIHCELNREEKRVRYVTVLASDDGTPPMDAYYDVPIELSDVNDRQTAVTVQPEMIPEGVKAGQPLVQFVTVDEDIDQIYTYTILEDASGLFRVDGDKLVATRQFDFETEPGASFEIVVKSDDDAKPPLSVTSTLRMQIEDIDEPPYDLHLSSINGFYPFEVDKPQIKENVKTAMLGTISVKDDDKDDVIVISFSPGGDAGGRLKLFNTRCTAIATVNVYCTVSVILMGAFDYEKENSVPLSVVAADSSGKQVTLETNLTVTDENDPPETLVMNNEDRSTLDVVENTKDVVIATLSTMDEDKGDMHAFELVDSAAGRFSIRGKELKVSPTAILDFERQKKHTLKVKVVDNGSPEQFTIFDVTINVIDVNEPPSSTTLSNKKIVENSPDGTVLGELTTIDPDNALEERQHFRYSLPDDAHGRFRLHGSTILARRSTHMCGSRRCELDFEHEPRLTITVLTLDSGTPRSRREDKFTIEVEDTNDPPTDIQMTSYTIRENEQPGTAVGDLLAYDQDGQQGITFLLLTYADIFSINNDLTLVTKVALNYERLRSYRVTVLAADSGTPPAESQETVVIKVINVNEVPVFTNVSAMVTVREDAAVNLTIGTFGVTDPDSGEKLTVTLMDTTDTFMIEELICRTTPLTGATDCTVTISVSKPLNRHSQNIHSIRLTVQDNGGMTSSADVQIHVKDVNDPPTDILFDGLPLTSITVQENPTSPDVATLSTVDEDTGQTYTYRLVNDTADLFTIDDNKLRLKDVSKVDYESVDAEVRLEIETTDSGSPALTFRKVLQVTVEDVNEPPSSIELTPSEVTENSEEGTTIGTLTIQDPDNVSRDVQTFSISLIDTANGLFAIEDDVVKVAADSSQCASTGGGACKLNYEKVPAYTVQVSVTDSGSPPLTATFNVNISVQDINDSPRNIKISANQFREGSPSGTVVGQLTVEDEDPRQGHVFSLVDDVAGVLEVSTDGAVTVKDSSGKVESTIVTIKVKAEDSGSPPMAVETYITTLVVGVFVADISLTAEGLENTFEDSKPNVEENVAVGTKVATVVATYPMVGEQLNLNLTKGMNAFGIRDVVCTDVVDKTICKGDLTTVTAVNYEEQSWRDIVIQVVTSQGKTYTDQFTVTITDVNETPTNITFSGDTIKVKENSLNAVIGQFRCTDPDPRDSHVFTVSGADVLVVTGSGTLSTAPDASIDYEKIPEFNISVTATDSGGFNVTRSFLVTVQDVNEPPESLRLSNDQIAEMSSPGSVVGELVASDPDNDQSFVFTLLTSADGRFQINGSTLQVGEEGPQCGEIGGTFCLLDFESQTSYNLTVIVTDSGQPALKNQFQVTVKISDANDKPRGLSINTTKVKEGLSADTVVATLGAIDDDVGQRLTFSVAASDAFAINGNEMVVTKVLDFEAEPQVTVEVTATDDGDSVLSVKKSFTIDVIDVNEAPSSLKVVSTAESSSSFPDGQPIISENLPASTLIGQIIVNDPDATDVLVIHTLSPDVVLLNEECIPVAKGTRCTIDMRSGRQFDFEEESTIDISVVATDKDGLQIKETIQLTVTDANDPPMEIYTDGQLASTLSVAENSRDVVLATLSVKDEETDQTYTYRVTDDNKAVYIVGDNLKVSSAAELDYETADEFVVGLRATDSGLPPLSLDTDLTITVTNVNEAPTDMFISKKEVPENAEAGFVIGTLSAQDPDNTKTDIQTFTYELLEEATIPFKIEGDQLLVSDSTFDFEKKKEYSIQIVVTDSGDPVLNNTFSLKVAVLDSNDPPTQLQFSGTEVQENSVIGHVIGTLSARDEDTSQHLVYSIMFNDALSIRGDKVVVNGPVDFETSPILTIDAKVTDDGSPPLSMEKNFTVKVTDINERPVSLTVHDTNNMTISEGARIDDVIAVLETSDEDRTDLLKLRVTGGGNVVHMLPAGVTCSIETVEGGSEMTKCTTQLLLSAVLDFETILAPVSVTVEVEDKGGLTYRQTWAFRVTNVNEPPRDILLDTDLDSIPENHPNYVIGTLSTVDDDSDDVHTYQLITFWEIFTVTGGKLIAKAPLDYEMHEQYVFSIKSLDNGSPPLGYTKEFTINVKNVNEAPSSIELSHSEVENDAENGYVVGHVSVVDPDNTPGSANMQTHTCTLSPPDVFSLDTNSSAVKVHSSIPLETSQLEITVNCTDNGEPAMSTSQDFLIDVVEVVVAPKGIKFRPTSGEEFVTEIGVDENVEEVLLGTFVVVNLLTMAADDGSYLFLVDDSAMTTVSVAGSSLTLRATLDYETTPKLPLTIQAMGVGSAGNQISLNETLTIVVADVNEPPTDVGMYGDSVVIENSQEGAVVGDLFTNDPEPDQTYTYTLIAVNYGLEVQDTDTAMLPTFAIDGKTLKVGSAATNLNHEVSDVISLLVKTVDSGDPPYSTSGVIHLRVDDANDPPTGINLTATTVPENSPAGTLVGTFSVEDEDKGQEQQCEILNMIDVPFKITDKTSLAVASNVLDFEGQKLYNVKVSCGDTDLDGTRLRFTETFLISLTNVNEAPFNLTLVTSEVEEGKPIGHIVTEIQAVDPDSQKISFVLTEGSDNFRIEGDSTLTATISFDYETVKFYTIVIQAGDEEGEIVTDTFEIKVIDMNEPPTGIHLDATNVSEREPTGTVVGRFQTDDPDYNQQFTYSLDKNTTDTGVFTIHDSELLVGPSGVDYETVSQHKVTVTSTDNGVPPQSTQIEFLIKILDANEAPSEIILGRLDAVAENAPPRTVITTIHVDDPDENQEHSCQLSSADPDLMAINAKTKEELDLVLIGTLNYEMNKDILVKLSCTDGEFDITKNISITVLDVNEPPTAVKLSGSNTVKADAGKNYVIGDITVVDEDLEQSHTFTILGPNSDILEINAKPQLVLKTSIPRQQFEKADPSLVFTITVADSGDPVLTYSQTFTIPITNIQILVDELPPIIIDTKNISRNARAWTVIGRLYAMNKTIDDSVHFSVLTNYKNVFEIVNNTHLAIQREIKDIDSTSMQVTVKVEDSETFESATKTITVFITESDTCTNNGDMCGDNAKCVTHNDTYSACECMVDFVRESNNVCTVVDNCKANSDDEMLCENDGTCVDGVNSYTCICQDGYSGERCEVKNKTNVCASRPCQNKGVCISSQDGESYTCSCSNGWTGDVCDTSINDCVDSTCYQGGTCVDAHLTYVCACSADRKGVKCEYSADICVKKYCNVTHICVGLMLKTQTMCLLETKYVITLKYKPVNVDLKVLQARLTDFIIKYGRLPNRNPQKVRRKRDIERRYHQIQENSGHLDVGPNAPRNRNFPQDAEYLSEHKTFQFERFSNRYDHIVNEESDTLEFDFLLDSDKTHFRKSVADIWKTPSLFRNKRDSDPNTIQVYVTDAQKTDAGELVYDLVIMDGEEVPFEGQTALEILDETCKSINSKELTESVFCPSIIAAARGPPPKEPSSSASIGIIAGAAGGGVVLLIIIVVVIVILKKKKGNVVKPEDTMETASRRSSGYASLSKPHRPLPALPRNKVAPESLTDVEHVTAPDDMHY